MSNKNWLNISIADNRNNVLYSEIAWSQDIIVNQEQIEVIKLEDNNIKLRLKNFNGNGSVRFNDFPAPVEVENKHKVNKSLWNKLVSNGVAHIYNEMVDSLKGIKEWHSADNGKTSFDTDVLAHNAAFMYLSTKFRQNAKKSQK